MTTRKDTPLDVAGGLYDAALSGLAEMLELHGGRGRGKGADSQPKKEQPPTGRTGGPETGRSGPRDYGDSGSSWSAPPERDDPVSEMRRAFSAGEQLARDIAGAGRSQESETLRELIFELAHLQMESLKIPHDWGILPGVGHDIRKIYEALGERTASFYRDAFAGASAK